MGKTLGQQLDEVQEAIAKALQGQNVSADGKSVEMPHLKALREDEKELIAQIQIYGRDYIPGQNSKPLPRRKKLVFGS